MVVDELKLRFASVVGSDCHSFKGAAVPGSRYTRIKMARPSLEGLRLAFAGWAGCLCSALPVMKVMTFVPFNTPEAFHRIDKEIRDAIVTWGRGKTFASLSQPLLQCFDRWSWDGKNQPSCMPLRLAYRREKELLLSSEAGQTFKRFNQACQSRNDEGGLRGGNKLLCASYSVMAYPIA